MSITPMSVEAERIDGADGLDTIHVFWVNVKSAKGDFGSGKGYVTIICYGCAWTAYFGGMNGKTIQQFFASVDVDYLVTKLGIKQQLKQGKKFDVHLGRIVKAIQAAMQLQRPGGDETATDSKQEDL
jgi:hypothetical protein